MELDEKTLFYLKNQQQIDEWAALSKSVSQASDKYFRSLLPAVESLASSLPESPRVAVDFESQYRKITLSLKDWYTDAGDELLGVCLVWSNKSKFTSLRGIVHSNRNLPAYHDLYTTLFTRFKEAPETSGFKKGKWWIIYQGIEPSMPEYWEELESFKGEIIVWLEHYWKLFQPIISEELRRYASTG